MAQRATSLGPKPSLFLLFVFFFVFFPLPFLYLLFNRKTQFFPPKKGNFCLFICVSLCFSLALFGPPPFFPFSFFVSLLLFSFFLPVFHLSFWLFIFLFFGLLLGSRCYVVFLFLLVVFFCFESSCLIYFCFVSCFLILVVFGFCCFHIL